MTSEMATRLGTSARATLNRARGAFRRLRPGAVEQAAHAHVERLKQDSEAFRRLPRAEHARIREDVIKETTVARRRAAAVAGYRLGEVRDYVAEGLAWLDGVRRDPLRSFPDALDHVDRNGMIGLAVYRELRRPTLAAMAPGDLFGAYQAALRRKTSPDALVDVTLIEDLLRAGLVHAAQESGIAALRSLRLVVAEEEELRTPADCPPWDDIAKDASRLEARAIALELAPINPDHDPAALAAYNAEGEACDQAGEASDADDWAEQQEAAKAKYVEQRERAAAPLTGALQ